VNGHRKVFRLILEQIFCSVISFAKCFCFFLNRLMEDAVFFAQFEAEDEVDEADFKVFFEFQEEFYFFLSVRRVISFWADHEESHEFGIDAKGKAELRVEFLELLGEFLRSLFVNEFFCNKYGNGVFMKCFC